MSFTQILLTPLSLSMNDIIEVTAPPIIDQKLKLLNETHLILA